MLQQEVCFIHIRICVASGHVVPDISFKSLLYEKQSYSNYNPYSYLTEKDSSHSEQLDQCVINVIKPLEIDLENLDENDVRETQLKLKGFRYERDLIIETFTMSKFSSNNLANSKIIMNDCDDISASTSVSSNLDGPLEKNTSASNTSEAYVFGKSHKKRQTYAASVSKSLGEKDCVYPSNNYDHANKKILVESESTSATVPLFSNSNLQHTKVPFFSGNPAVDITNGIIHLYKTNFKVKVGEDVCPPSTNTLCMLSVPANIDIHNLLEFTAPYMEVIQQMRIIRDRTPSQFMVLLTFLTDQDACEFYLNLNSQPFSSLIPEEVCHLAFVASVEALAPPRNKDTEQKDQRFLPLPNCTELPDCMVCLERMDESVQGLLTVLCNHSFHAACLQKWEDLCCPVCRYVQTPEPQSNNKCMVCGAAEDLWICLVCGRVGCGRYTSEHAQRHYLETHHNYAMSLSDNRVWDYAGDYFVHRLFQNKDDGKLVEKNTASEEQDAKFQEIQVECMRMLTTQLETQRKYWEEQLIKTERKLTSERDKMTKELEKEKEERKEIQSKVSYLELEKKNMVHRCDKLNSKLRDALRDLANEREMNKGLSQNQDAWKEKVKTLEERCGSQDAELQELKEQLRDVMFYIEASQKISGENKELQDELKEGQVVVGPSSSNSQKSRSKNKRRTR